MRITDVVIETEIILKTDQNVYFSVFYSLYYLINRKFPSQNILAEVIRDKI